MKVKVISLPYIFQVLYVLCFTRPRYQVSVYRTIGPLVIIFLCFFFSNAAKFININPAKQPGNTNNNTAAFTESKRSKLIRNSKVNNAGTQQTTINRGNQKQNTNNRNVAGNQRNKGTVKFLNIWMPENHCNLPKIKTKRPNLSLFPHLYVQGKYY